VKESRILGGATSHLPWETLRGGGRARLPPASVTAGTLGTVDATLSAPEELLLAVDLLEPPQWEPADRPPLLPHQVPPAGKWSLWLLEGGRGSGKTEACSRYFGRYMREHPGARGRIIAPTNGDAVEACVRGPSGLLAIDPEIRFVAAAAGGGKCYWPNGSEALVIGTSAPRDVERLRAAGNRDLDWWEEAAANSQLGPAWDMAAFGLRSGRPHSIASTTPRPTPDYRRLREMQGVVRTHATLPENPYNPPEWVARMEARYGGTRLGRQELLGELISDTPGALWKRDLFENRASEPQCTRIVVAVDPAVTSGERADDTGIIVAGVGPDGHAYVLEDATCHETPDGWARRVAWAYERWHADRVIVEVNNGGELVTQVLKAAHSNLPIKSVHASRGKMTRAEPIVALYEQGKIHHVGAFPELEDECCTWLPGVGDSPDRLDALVWALTELVLEGSSVSAPSFRTGPSRWPAGGSFARVGGW
jgi:phage terminase large subunit-like protein